MERDQVIAALKAHEEELRMVGVLSVSLFGSVARGENSAQDVDVAVRLGANFSAPPPSTGSGQSRWEPGAE
jgi:predicted nucleotidyltransferase